MHNLLCNSFFEKQHRKSTTIQQEVKKIESTDHDIKTFDPTDALKSDEGHPFKQLLIFGIGAREDFLQGVKRGQKGK